MPNEFYCAYFDNGEQYFFRNKDKAFDCVWQQFLNANAGYLEEIDLKEARVELYELYFIEGFGGVGVCGFQD